MNTLRGCILDDDSEPILGQWFEETLAPPDTTEAKSPSTSDNVETKTSQSDRIRSIVPERGEAHGYISLATSIFVFLNKHFLCSKSTYITRYVKNGLTEQQMIILAAIIRDLDRETARTEVGKLIYCTYIIFFLCIWCFKLDASAYQGKMKTQILILNKSQNNCDLTDSSLAPLDKYFSKNYFV